MFQSGDATLCLAGGEAVDTAFRRPPAGAFWPVRCLTAGAFCR